MKAALHVVRVSGRFAFSGARCGDDLGPTRMHAKLLADFCRQFDSAVRPLLPPLAHAREAIEHAPDNSGADLLTPLRELDNHLVALLDKVKEQHAYVLIFGPLKSGKSTLMNALAAAYVSEVSCLPAYPCLVFVSHGDKRRYQLTRFDGTSEPYDASDVVATRIQEAHQQLAEHLRAAEAEGRTFDPAVHFPQAIRRIDVRLPARNLAASGAVLVDTPGLYSRMRFGYSQMTRDFRNAAACAVFVVKSDNLFLEQVFEEFQELLDLFSRIFLIVNVDSTKRDLRPDGDLAPSLEQTRPDQIVAAFEQLAMTAALKRAHDEGRLRIYPIDLMRAASARVRGEGKPTVQPADFATFDQDLTDFLASPDYLAAFLGDSLRRAHTLLSTGAHINEHATLVELERRRVFLEQERMEAQAQIAAADRVLAHAWEQAFAGFAGRVRADVQNRAHEIGVKTVRLMEAGLEQWFMSGASVRTLLDAEWRPQFKLFRDQIEAEAKESLERSLQERDGGMDEGQAPAADLRALGADVAALRRRAADEVLANPMPPVPKLGLDTATIPIKRAVGDWALLRSLDKVRASLFGTDAGLDHKITAKMKAARLGEAGKRFLRDHLQAEHDRYCKEASQQVVERMSKQVNSRAAAELRARVAERRQQAQERMRDLDKQCNLCTQVLSPLKRLTQAMSETHTAVKTLAQQHGITQLTPLEDVVILPRPTAAAPELTIQPRGRMRRR
jgi:energy-coupling factor transporter ATP-binding protein EcfA2